MLTNQDFTKLIMINDTINFLGILTRITSDLYYSNDKLKNMVEVRLVVTFVQAQVQEV